MRKSVRILLSLLMFVFFTTSMGVRGFDLKELSHDLDHHGQANIESLAQIQKGTLKTGGNPKPEPLDEIEHQLLHAVGELHFLASATASASWDTSMQILMAAVSSPSLSMAELESPFRPPRSSAFI